ncbi:S8 family serine peptidase [Neolewinella agarilytica]|uniref:Por secretion system C-terminal sorting domain-containing protein n=1 Tax=Neolewinella agarilytica TaxID=478744 RepID=A0A1H9G7M1_9BACT|nr:S8 family serine peptidase [Neolewinella agarilytica]SEQ46050.1 Por secretion system C-terminal sorting domain-containing protein [Neolewinella agarilytica]
MKFLTPLLTLSTLLFFATSLCAQQLDYRQGELIVQLGADVDAGRWLKAREELRGWQQLGRRQHTYLLRFDFNEYGEEQLRRKLWKDPAVQLVQLNHLLTKRARPDDPRYDDQYSHRNTGQLNGVIGADHNMEAAWDITTGGLTANGDTIVVAVLDDGVDLDHEDFVGNLWRNYDEIPNNGIDDDNNGYIDDYFGYDTEDNDGNPDAGSADDHGTPVAGIIGARGNNGRGVAGMNWSVKLMNIRNGFLSSESEVLQAYSYALEARQRYDETDGAEGAYVVVTNASWGRDRGNADDSPVWCGLYDRLGEAGIINAGATINANINVEEEGDLPTNCSSPYLLGVTNLNARDEKVMNAGFGNISIDLGAYGEETFTTEIGNGYGYFGGTSAATPQVAGAMALLYAAPCQTFAELLAADPAAAALTIREVLLTTVSPNTSLAGITVTGGRLNVGAAMEELMTRCDDCLSPTSFTAEPVAESATSLVVDWKAIESLGNLTLRYRVAGTETWTNIAGATAPYTIEGLPACVSYDLQLLGNCGDKSVETSILTTSTDGCCAIPEDFAVSAFDNQVFLASWTPSLAGNFYRVRYRKQGEEDWTTRTSVQNQLGISGGVEPCTAYEFEFQTDCDTTQTEFGRTMVVISTGCGACLEEDYCIPNDFSNNQEWIRRVDLGGLLVNESGREEDAYRNYGERTSSTFARNAVYPLRLTPGFPGGEGIEGFRVYIDWNQDGFFASSEIVFEGSNEIGESTIADITVPDDAALRQTRMRVMMQFRGVRGSSCGSNGFGEVEDYCLDIAEAAEGCPAPRRLTATYDAAEEVTNISWAASAAAGGDYRVRYRLRGTMDPWTEEDVRGTAMTVGGLNLCGTYEVELASLCGGEPGPARIFYFMDDCTDTDNPLLSAADWTVFPNPATETTQVRLNGSLRVESLTLLSIQGRHLRSAPPSSAASLDLDLRGIVPGIYLLELRANDGRRGVRKLVVR